MGYRTYYNLKWEATKGNKNKLQIKADLDKAVADYIENDHRMRCDDSELWYAIDTDGNSRGDVKWYDHDQEMCIMSECIPNTLFTLSGEGEEQGDLWRAYYLNGKYQHIQAVLSYAPFDESKLKKPKKTE